MAINLLSIVWNTSCRKVDTTNTKIENKCKCLLVCRGKGGCRPRPVVTSLEYRKQQQLNPQWVMAALKIVPCCYSFECCTKLDDEKAIQKENGAIEFCSPTSCKMGGCEDWPNFPNYPQILLQFQLSRSTGKNVKTDFLFHTDYLAFHIRTSNHLQLVLSCVLKRDLLLNYTRICMHDHVFAQILAGPTQPTSKVRKPPLPPKNANKIYQIP